MSASQKLSVLIVQMEGLGNAILTTPLIQAVASLGHRVSVLVDPSRASHIAFTAWPCIERLVFEPYPADVELWCHPVWQHKFPPKNRRVYTPVANLPGPWLDRFQKHEVEYLMDMARDMGYAGPVPPLRVYSSKQQRKHKRVAVGIGYLKAGTNQAWPKKHWGNDKYAGLCRLLLDRLNVTPVLVGDGLDFAKDGCRILSPGVESVCGRSLYDVVDSINDCDVYIGNDTGLMHVAAALKKPCIAMFMNTSIVKNHPWGVEWVAFDGKNTDPVTVVNQLETLFGL